MNIIDREILRLAVPSIVSNITVPLLGLVDLAISGHLGDGGGSGEAYIAAISVGSMIFNVIYWLMGFLRMGTSGMTSQAFGAGDGRGVRLLLSRSLTLAVTIAAAFLVLQWPIREVALAVIHPSGGVGELARTYFNIVIWGAPAMLSLYSLNGWFIGMQNTRVPMVVAIFQNVVNIIASLTLVVGFGMKVEGIATGTLIAQWSGALLAVVMVRREVKAVSQRHAETQHHTETQRHAETQRRYTWGAFFRVNRDIFLRTVCLVAVNLAFTSLGARQGDMMLAVNTLLMTFYTLFSYVMDGFAFAGEALSGRYYGARDDKSLTSVIHRLLRRWGLPLALLFTLLYVFGGSGLVHLLTDDAGVVAAAESYLPWACLIPLAGYGAFVYDGIFIGLTATRGMLVSSFTASLTFFAIAGAMVGWGMVSRTPLPFFNHILWLSFIAYLAMRGVMQHQILQKIKKI